MKTLPQILKTWHLEKQVLTSPPIRDRKEYKQIKDLLDIHESRIVARPHQCRAHGKNEPKLGLAA